MGVPVKSSDDGKEYYYLSISGKYVDHCCYESDSDMSKNFMLFHSKESALKNSEMLIEWRKTLVANSKGEPIDIQALLPLLRKGYVAMDKSGNWFWFSGMPIKDWTFWRAGGKSTSGLSAFNLKPAKNWEDSLMECGI